MLKTIHQPKMAWVKGGCSNTSRNSFSTGAKQAELTRHLSLNSIALCS